MRITRKFIERIIVGLLMIAPLAYLFGTQISYLAGAHGTAVMASSSDWVETTSFDGDEYKFVFDENPSIPYNSSLTYTFDFTLDFSVSDIFWNGILLGYSSASSPSVVRYFVSGGSKGINVYNYYDSLSWISYSEWATIYFDSLSLPSLSLLNYGTLYRKELNTESIYANFFANDNFLQNVGKDSISQSPKGFAPFGSLISYLDVNFLHLSSSQIGLMAYGYLYWVLHVLFLYVMYKVVAWIPLLIVRMFDWFDAKKGD